jgi:hypothetical protein
MIAFISTLCASPTCSLLVSLSLSLQTRQVRSIDSLSCADSEGHQPRIIGTPIRDTLYVYCYETIVFFSCLFNNAVNIQRMIFSASVVNAGKGTNEHYPKHL